MSQRPPLLDRCRDAANAIRQSAPTFPSVGVVLGSGLGAFSDRLTDAIQIPYAKIPHFPEPTVAGHRGMLAVGTVAGRSVAVLQGRFHHYEGHDLDTVTFPVRVLKTLGVGTLILTAAVGAIQPAFRPGAMVVVRDHLNLLGANPLRGPNPEAFGERFPDMSEVYPAFLREIARDAAQGLGLTLSEGIYAVMPGPSYETPAEIRALRTLGADVVGMSTVPEAIVARHAGMNVLALAVVSNWAAGIAATPITHAEVLEAGREAGPRLADLLEAILPRLN